MTTETIKGGDVSRTDQWAWTTQVAAGIQMYLVPETEPSSIEVAEPEELPRSRWIAGLPENLIAAYAAAAVRHALVNELEDGTFFASIVGLPGVWGSGASSADASDDLLASIPDWVVVHRDQGIEIPAIDGFDLNL